MKNLSSEKKVPVVGFLTDFGTRDWYVSSMKAVVAGSGKLFQAIDISHEIEAGDIQQASFVLANGHSCFPKGSVFVVVVDPGVGTKRKPLCIKADGYYFIGPDNGIFSESLKDKKKIEIREIKIKKAFSSHTFHGRDVFAPAAGDLLRGVPFSRIGPRIKSIKHCEFTAGVILKNEAAGEIIYIDHFGNGITNLKKTSFKGENISKAICRKRTYPFVNTFGDVPSGKKLCFWGSSGYLELAVNMGSALGIGRIQVGDKVRLQLKS